MKRRLTIELEIEDGIVDRFHDYQVQEFELDPETITPPKDIDTWKMKDYMDAHAIGLIDLHRAKVVAEDGNNDHS